RSGGGGIRFRGHPAGAEKLFTSPVCVSDSRDAVQAPAAFSFKAEAEADAAPLFGTTIVMLVVLICAFGKATVTSPVYTPGAIFEASAVTASVAVFCVEVTPLV